jgi:transcriptional regulator with XRE-family HTH domain
MTSGGIGYQLWWAVEEERLNQGWTVDRMADHIGLPRNTISRLKTGKRPPAVSTVHTIADALQRLGSKITRMDAERMAGLRPPLPAPGAGNVREALKTDTNFTDEQREMMLQLIDVLLAANQRAQTDQQQD